MYTHPHRRLIIPMRGLPEELCAEGNSLPSPDDAHRAEALQLSALPEGIHAEGAVEGSPAHAHEPESVGHPAALLHAVSEGVLPRVGFEQAFGYAHGKDF